MKDKLAKRDRLSRVAGYFFPSIHTQLTMNTIGKSDLGNYLNYINGLEKFHEKTRLYFYPKIFDEIAVDTENWEGFHLEYFHDNRPANGLALIPPIIIIILIMLTANKIWNKA